MFFFFILYISNAHQHEFIYMHIIRYKVENMENKPNNIHIPYY